MERENGGQIGEIGAYVLWSFRIRGDNHGTDKNPLFTAFPHSATLFHIVGDLPSNRVYERLFFKRLYAVFWGNHGIWGFIPKPCV
jgi:hypothetical protein